ncbi:MAG: HNH endonuclease [Acidobacteria bacterium]|nr:HNH endonuclease [Acidobacteriota bacterium]
MRKADWKKRSYTREEFVQAWLTSKTVGEVAKKLGRNRSGGGYVVLKTAARELSLPTDHMIEYGFSTGPSYNRYRSIPLSAILIKDSSYTNIARLKIRLLREGLLEARCDEEDCGLTDWKGRPIALQLDHINGDKFDHRIENLRLLCPNCHSQTDTFAGRNKRN